MKTKSLFWYLKQGTSFPYVGVTDKEQEKRYLLSISYGFRNSDEEQFSDSFRGAQWLRLTFNPDLNLATAHSSDLETSSGACPQIQDLSFLRHITSALFRYNGYIYIFVNERKVVLAFFVFLGDSTNGTVVLANWETAEELWIMQSVPALQGVKKVPIFWKLESHNLWFVGDSELSVPLSMGTFMSVCSYEGSLTSSNMGV